MRNALFKRGVTLNVEAWGKNSESSVVLLKRIVDGDSAETLMGIIKVSHPKGIIEKVLLHTDSEEFIRELKEKGINLAECD